MNTHSRHADSRAELMTAAAIRAGADLETAKRLLDTITTEEAIDILNEKNLTDHTMKLVTDFCICKRYTNKKEDEIYEESSSLWNDGSFTGGNCKCTCDSKG